MEENREKKQAGEPRPVDRVERRRRRTRWITFGVLLAALAGLLIFIAGLDDAVTTGETAVLRGVSVVIDAGHGGDDSGTIGVVTGAKEAHINLTIAKKLRDALTSSGAQVIMTRSDGNAIGETKEEDMANRRRIIEESGQDLTISIHQNHYDDPDVKGPQVFYAPGSAEGEKLAGCIQQRMNAELEVVRPRSAMAGNYYIVRSGAAPAVIVECGFLSNPEEDVLLSKKFYRIKVTKAILEGIEDYLNLAKGA